MQATTLPLRSAKTRQILATALASLAAGAAVFVVAGNDTTNPIAPAPDSVSSDGTVSELSSYDAQLLRHHGIKAAAPVASAPIEPTAAQRAAAERFHHFR